MSTSNDISVISEKWEIQEVEKIPPELEILVKVFWLEKWNMWKIRFSKVLRKDELDKFLKDNNFDQKIKLWQKTFCLNIEIKIFEDDMFGEFCKISIDFNWISDENINSDENKKLAYDYFINQIWWSIDNIWFKFIWCDVDYISKCPLEWLKDNFESIKSLDKSSEYSVESLIMIFEKILYHQIRKYHNTWENQAEYLNMLYEKVWEINYFNWLEVLIMLLDKIVRYSDASWSSLLKLEQAIVAVYAKPWWKTWSIISSIWKRIWGILGMSK